MQARSLSKAGHSWPRIRAINPPGPSTSSTIAAAGRSTDRGHSGPAPATKPNAASAQPTSANHSNHASHSSRRWSHLKRMATLHEENGVGARVSRFRCSILRVVSPLSHTGKKRFIGRMRTSLQRAHHCRRGNNVSRATPSLHLVRRNDRGSNMGSTKAAPRKVLRRTSTAGDSGLASCKMRIARRYVVPPVNSHRHRSLNDALTPMP